MSIKYGQTMLTFLPKEEGPTMNRLKYGNKQNSNKRKKMRDGGERMGGVEVSQLKLSVNSDAVHILTCSPYHVSETSGKPEARPRRAKPGRQRHSHIVFYMVKADVSPSYNCNG